MEEGLKDGMRGIITESWSCFSTPCTKNRGQVVWLSTLLIPPQYKSLHGSKYAENLVVHHYLCKFEWNEDGPCQEE